MENGNVTENAYVNNCTIKGRDNVGGAMAIYEFGKSIYNVNVADSNISGENSVGGIVGTGGNLYDSIIINSTIEGKNTDSKNVGGLLGVGQWQNSRCGVISCNIISKGTNVGGILGQGLSNNNSFSINNYIEGYSNVGGIVGYGIDKTMQYNYTNATVVATEHSAGGLVGYLDNSNMNNINNVSSIYRNYYSEGTIRSKTNVGGIIGETATELYDKTTTNYYSANYIEATLISENTSTISLGIGNMPEENTKLVDTYFYKYSNINGANPNKENEPYIKEEQYLVEEQLKQQTTYTNNLKWGTANFDYNILAENKYPILKYNNEILPNQSGIDIPKDLEHNLAETTGTQASNKTEDETLQTPEQTFEYAGKQITTYSNYSIIEDAEGNSVKRDTKLYLKDGNLFALSPNMDMVDGNFIIDSYNGKEYETVLGTDGKLYDLKEKITYPENFKNEDINSIGNNLNTEEKEVEVTYNNGDKIKFNYQTGEVISEEKLDENKTELIEFIQDKLTTKEEAITINEAGYEDTKELIQKLEEVPVEKAEEIKKNNEQQTNQTASQDTNITNYITTYNTTSDRYEIYNEEDLLSTTKQTVETENEKIEKNNLSSFYSTQISKAPEESGKTVIYIIILAVIIVLAILIRYNINKNKQTRK